MNIWLWIAAVAICPLLVSASEQEDVIRRQFAEHRAAEQRSLSVALLTAELRRLREESEVDLRKGEERITALRSSNVHEAIVTFHRFGELLAKRKWEDEISLCELKLLYATITSHLNSHDGKLPESLDAFVVPPELDTRRYDYFRVGMTNELSSRIILLATRELTKFGDGRETFISDGDRFWAVDIADYKMLLQNHQGSEPRKVAREMRKVVPQLFVVMGNGTIQSLRKSDYKDVIAQNNAERRKLREQILDQSRFDKLFESVDESAYGF